MDQIREIVLSWQAMDIIEIAGGNDYVVLSLLNLLGDEDPTIRLRALTALGELLKEQDGKIRPLIIKNSFSKLVSLLGDDDPRIVTRSIEVLSQVLEGVQIDEARLSLLLNGAIDVARRDDTFLYITLLDLLGRLQLPPLGWEVRRRIDELLSSDDLYVKTVGARLLLSSGNLEGRGRTVLECVRGLLDSGNVLLIETGLSFLEEVLTFHLSTETMAYLVEFLSLLKGIENGAENVIIRARASNVRTELEKVLSSYYSSRPEEALEVIRGLLVRGRAEDGLTLALIVGGTPLLLRLLEEEAGRGDSELAGILKTLKDV